MPAYSEDTELLHKPREVQIRPLFGKGETLGALARYALARARAKSITETSSVELVLEALFQHHTKHTAATPSPRDLADNSHELQLPIVH